ncbi:acyl-CoA dehydrogenase family protein [bacterium]|nr:acyl-CoA dehydrogenase family protein [bacterium]
MDFEFSNEEKRVLVDVRDFIKSESTPEMLEESHELGHIYGGREGRKFIRKFAAHGWLTPDWPEEYGGIGSSAVLNFAIREEMAHAGVLLFLWPRTWPVRQSCILPLMR